ncbi:MAG: hypothetical protein PUE10_08140, partial [Bacteroidales bacterium]|nr:hypothetical protein [Bacteroidales bacterium]
AVVADAGHVCRAGAAVYLLSAGRLLKLENSRLTALDGEWRQFDRLVYCADRDELLLASTDDNEATSLPVGGSGVYTTPLVLRPLGGHSGLLPGGASVYAATEDGLVDLGRRGNEPVPVSWTATVTPKAVRAGQRFAAALTEIPLWTDTADLTVSVRRAYMGRSALLKSYHVKGAVRSPLLLRLGVRPGVAVEISVQGTARPDTLLGRPTLTPH